jgi:hypothetical protein
MKFEYEGKDIEITASDFSDYESVRLSGVTNMWNTKLVKKLSGLSNEKIMVIMKHYSEIKKEAT